MNRSELNELAARWATADTRVRAARAERRLERMAVVSPSFEFFAALVGAIERWQ